MEYRNVSDTAYITLEDNLLTLRTADGKFIYDSKPIGHLPNSFIKTLERDFSVDLFSRVYSKEA